MMPDPQLPAVIVPRLEAVLVKSDQRHAAFREKLAEKASVVFQEDRAQIARESIPCQEEAPPEDPAWLRLLSRACALCRGYCCYHGGDHAYLDAITLQLVIRESGVSSVQELLDQYCERIPEWVFENSCIFHGAMGCGLPGQMRSSICKAYLCEGLKAIRARPGEMKARASLFATNIDDDAAPEAIIFAQYCPDDIPY